MAKGKNASLNVETAIIRDVSERKHAEEALRESDNQLRILSKQLLLI